MAALRPGQREADAISNLPLLRSCFCAGHRRLDASGDLTAGGDIRRFAESV